MRTIPITATFWAAWNVRPLSTVSRRHYAARPEPWSFFRVTTVVPSGYPTEDQGHDQSEPHPRRHGADQGHRRDRRRDESKIVGPVEGELTIDGKPERVVLENCRTTDGEGCEITLRRITPEPR